MICDNCKYSIKYQIHNPITKHKLYGHCSCQLHAEPMMNPNTYEYDCEYFAEKE